MKFIQPRKRAAALTRDHAPSRQIRKPPKSWATADATREKIVEFLAEPRSAKQVAEHIKRNQAITNYHLHVLKKSNRIMTVGKSNASKWVKTGYKRGQRNLLPDDSSK